MPRAARPASTSPRTDATRGDPRQKEKLLETITETEVPNLKHVWQKSRTIIPPTGVVHGHRYIAQLWNKTHREKPASWANYWDPGPAYGDKIKGHLIAFEPANLLSVCADHGGEAEGRRRGQHRPRLGAVADAEAVGWRQCHGIRRGGAVFRERPGVACAVLECCWSARWSCCCSPAHSATGSAHNDQPTSVDHANE